MVGAVTTREEPSGGASSQYDRPPVGALCIRGVRGQLEDVAEHSLIVFSFAGNRALALSGAFVVLAYPRGNVVAVYSCGGQC